MKARLYIQRLWRVGSIDKESYDASVCGAGKRTVPDSDGTSEGWRIRHELLVDCGWVWD